ncbi:MAG: hypothetical protein IPN69_07525 [Acidobacteria bacterium]|nr:hypothetical protein [Acidobacteriota bacterium]
MANLSEYEKLTVKERRNRTFSEEFRRKKVGEIERCVTSVSEVSRNIRFPGLQYMHGCVSIHV